MRASKLITFSTIAVLMGGTSLAIGQGVTDSLPGSNSMLGGSPIGQGGASGPETEGSNPRAAENPMRRGETSGERGANVQGSRDLQRGQPMTAERGRAIAGGRGLATTVEQHRAIAGERGRAIAGERGQAMNAERGRAIAGGRGLALAAEHRRAIGERGLATTGERGLAMAAERGRAAAGQGPKTAVHIQSQLGSHPRQSFGQMEAAGQAYGRATERNTGVGLNAEQRARLREIVSARRDIPRVSNLADVRVNAVIPRSVRLAAIPEEVVRIYPRFRRHQAFIYRNEIVVVDPLTSRIVAVLPA